MKRFTFLKSLVMLFALCLISTGSAWAQTEQTVTFDISTFNGEGEDLSTHPLVISPITISDERDGSGSNNAKLYQHIRLYNKNTLTVSAKDQGDVTITSVTFSFTSSQYQKKLTYNTGQYIETSSTEGIWSGSANEIKFTNNESAQARIDQIIVKFTTSAGFVAPPTFSLEPGTYNLGQSHELEINSDEGTTVYYALNDAPTYTEYTRPIILNKTTTISAYAEDAEDNRSEIVEATYTFEVAENNVFTAVTSTSDLIDGSTYILVCSDSRYPKALSSVANTGNNRTSADIEISSDGNIVCETNAQNLPYELTLGHVADNIYTLYDATSNVYLGISEDDNRLQDVSEPSENAQWSITMDGNSIVFTNIAYSDRTIRYNNSASCFAAYNRGQQPVTLYKKAAAATTGTFTIGKAGYATFFTDWTFVMPEGVEGGIVTGTDDGRLTVDYCYPASSIVPANTGLLLKGAAKTYTYDLSTETPDAPKVNYLKGSVDAARTEGEGCLFYMLSYDQNDENLGFYWGAADGAAFENGAGKAYLALPQSVASQVRGFVLDGTTTGISGVTTEANNAPAAVYSLTGVRMGTTTDGLPAGIYIVNGKKVLVK